MTAQRPAVCEKEKPMARAPFFGYQELNLEGMSPWLGRVCLLDPSENGGTRPRAFSRWNQVRTPQKGSMACREGVSFEAGPCLQETQLGVPP